MASIGSLGVGSGLDLETLVTKLISAEGTPRINSLATKEANIQADISAFGSLKSALDKFRSAVATLADASALQARTVSTGNSKYFSASAGESAVSGQYAVQVLNTARAQKLVSTADFANASALVGAGTLTISVGSASFQVTTTASTTIAELKALINDAADNAGVSASLLVVARDPLNAAAGTVARLALATDETGTANGIGITVSDADANDTDALGLSRFYFSSGDIANSQLDEQQAAADARIAVDGLTAFSSTNVFSDVIDGVTITALKTPADPLNPDVEILGIALDNNSVAARIRAFVTAYNEVVSAIQNRDVTGVAIYGYSHGGGSTADLAQRLNANRASIGVFSIDFTAYMDGIENDSDIDITPESQLPPSTGYHANYYERAGGFLQGTTVPGANLNVNVTLTPWGSGLTHFTVDDAPEVLQGILDLLVAHVAP